MKKKILIGLCVVLLLIVVVFVLTNLQALFLDSFLIDFSGEVLPLKSGQRALTAHAQLAVGGRSGLGIVF